MVSLHLRVTTITIWMLLLLWLFFFCETAHRVNGNPPINNGSSGTREAGHEHIKARPESMQVHGGTLAIHVSLRNPLYTTSAPPSNRPRVKIALVDRYFHDIVRRPCLLRRWEQVPSGRAAGAHPLFHAIGLRVRVLAVQMLCRASHIRQSRRLPLRPPRHLPERPGGTARGPPTVRASNKRATLGCHLRN